LFIFASCLDIIFEGLGVIVAEEKSVSKQASFEACFEGRSPLLWWDDGCFGRLA